MKRELPNVIVLTISGIRDSESLADPSHQYIPNLWNTLFPNGVLYTRLYPPKYTLHYPTVKAINTGTERHSEAWPGTIFEPTIFTLVGKRHALPKSKIWFIGGLEDRIDTCEHTSMLTAKFLHPETPLEGPLDTEAIREFLGRYEKVGRVNPSRWPIWDVNYTAMHPMTMDILRWYKPVLTHYVLGGVEAAHYDTFGRYVLALRTDDERIRQIWDLITTDGHYRDNTYLIVNVDGPRDANYKEHDYTRDPVWMYLYGPGIRKGATIDRAVRHTDIFATVAHLFDVQTPGTEGRVLQDAFAEPAG